MQKFGLPVHNVIPRSYSWCRGDRDVAFYPAVRTCHRSVLLVSNLGFQRHNGPEKFCRYILSQLAVVSDYGSQVAALYAFEFLHLLNSWVYLYKLTVTGYGDSGELVIVTWNVVAIPILNGLTAGMHINNPRGNKLMPISSPSNILCK